VLFALQSAGLTIVDGQQVFLSARRIKTPDEISLLTQACAMVDAAYDELYAFLRPGVRENECVGLVSKVLYDLGSEYVEGVNAISGLAPGAVVLETSTIHPDTVRALAPLVAGRDAMLLDSPVSGSVSVVERGQLTVMVGGDSAVLDRARPGTRSRPATVPVI
jgi:hypothetical protein